MIAPEDSLTAYILGLFGAVETGVSLKALPALLLCLL